MKEKWILLPGRRQIGKNRYFLRMKMTMGLVFLATLHLSASSFSQESKISLNMRQVSLMEILDRLQKVTAWTFLYQNELLDQEKKIDVNVKDKKMNVFLQELLQPRGLAWEIDDQVVVIRRAEPQQQKQVYVTIRGNVTDRQGNSLPGVTVAIQGTSWGGATDQEGNFHLQIARMEDITLIFSFVGMKKKEVKYQGQEQMKIVLEEEVAEMDEVVVTGIFSKDMESYTGAVSVITEKELKSFGNRNVLTTLRNIDPSFNIIESNEWGSNPNRLPEIQIRGTASLPDFDQLQDNTSQQLNTPLIILDGFEISLERMMDMNDDEIQSITLLKDASATAIYGSRGANGVVVITTKTPAMGKLRISYTGSVNIEVPDLSDYHVLNAREKLELERLSGYYDAEGNMEKDLKLKEEYSRLMQEVERGVDTYWLSQPLRTGVGHRHDFKLDGGDKTFRYALTLQYNSIMGVMKGSERNNFNGGINLSYYRPKVVFRNNLRIGANKATDSPYGSFDQYVKMNPYWTPYDENGKPIKSYSGLIFDSPVGNPLYNASLNTILTTDYVDLNDNFSIEYKPVLGLNLQAKVGITYKTNNSDKYLPGNHTSFETQADLFKRGSYQYGTGKSMNYNMALTANYSKVFAEKHMIYLGINYDLSQSKSRSYNFLVQGFMRETQQFLTMGLQYPEGGKPSGSESVSRRIGFVANASYSFHDRYLADFSWRTDGSSQYGAKKRFAPFWSAGIGWNIHREEFMKTVEFIDRMKIRGSVGVTGSNNFSANQATAIYSYYTTQRYYTWVGAAQNTIENPYLAWQKTPKYNLGLELGFLKSRFSVIADVYYEKTDGLVSSIDLPKENGFSSYAANIGEVENKGFELKLTANILQNTEKRLNWTVSGSLVRNINKIVSLSPIMIAANESKGAQHSTSPQKIYRVGDPVSSIYAVPSLGIDPSTGKELYRTKEGEVTYGWFAKDQVYCGVSQPAYRGNANMSFRYQGLSLNLSFRYQWGGLQYNSTLINNVENADKKMNVDRRVFEERWQKPGDHTFFKGLNEITSTYATSRFVQDETTFVCQNVNMAYEFRKEKWLKKFLGMESLVVKGNLEELFHVSTIKRERGTSYPFARQFSFSLNMVF